MRILYNHFAQSSFTVKFLIFIGIELLCLCFVSLLTIFLSFIFSGISLTRMALSAQDIILFILPALCAAYLFGGNPVRYLQADRSPGIGAVVGIVLCMLFSVPGDEPYHRMERIDNPAGDILEYRKLVESARSQCTRNDPQHVTDVEYRRLDDHDTDCRRPNRHW